MKFKIGDFVKITNYRGPERHVAKMIGSVGKIVSEDEDDSQSPLCVVTHSYYGGPNAWFAANELTLYKPTNLEIFFYESQNDNT